MVGYSQKINKTVNKKQFFDHLFSLPKQPKAIPYITSYYVKNWGFCIEDEKKKNLIKNTMNMINLKYS